MSAAVRVVGLTLGLGACAWTPATPEAEPSAEAPASPDVSTSPSVPSSPDAAPADGPAVEALSLSPGVRVVQEGSEPAVPALPNAPFTWAELEVDEAAPRAQLAAVAKQARERGALPVIQVYASWCGPCRELRAAWTDPRMQDAYAGTHVVLANADRWRGPLAFAGMHDGALSVPAIFVIEPDGGLGPSIDGHAWGANTPENMAPPLRDFFRARGAKPSR